MTNETSQGLERISYLPDRDDAENGLFIAGQKYYDVLFTGGTITGITPSGFPNPLAISDGGTGENTAADAINALVPSQAGNNGKVLSTNGTVVSWASDTSGITQLTGDVTAGPGSGSQAATLATVNSNVGTFGSATQVAQATVNAKGLITAVTNVTVTPAASSITGGAALTRTNDTNVTATLGGTPSTALLAATSITLGWTGLLAGSRGGTNNGFTEFTGPASSTKTFTLPNATATILTTNAAVTVSQGGTGLSTLTANNVILGNGTSNPTFVAPSTSGNVLTSNGTTWVSSALITVGTAQATTSGTTINLSTTLPTGIKKIDIPFVGHSTNGTTGTLVQIGSGSFATSGYISTAARVAAGGSTGVSTSTAGFHIGNNASAAVMSGTISLTHLGSNVWSASLSMGDSGGSLSTSGGGNITLGGALDRLRIITGNATDTFTAGSVNYIYYT